MIKILGVSKHEMSVIDAIWFYVCYENGYGQTYFRQEISNEGLFSSPDPEEYCKTILVSIANSIGGDELAAALDEHLRTVGTTTKMPKISSHIEYETITDGSFSKKSVTANYIHIDYDSSLIMSDWKSNYSFDDLKSSYSSDGIIYNKSAAPSQLADSLPGVKTIVSHPLLPQDDIHPNCSWARWGDKYDLKNTIIHMNDYHNWKREAIADWLDSLDVDLRFKV